MDNNLQNWVKSTYGVDIYGDAFKDYLDFLLLWNITEGKFFQADFAQTHTANTKLIPYDKVTLDETLKFFRARYVSDGKMSTSFNRLKFRSNIAKKVAKEVLLGNESDEIEQLKACFNIIYRLRCHLFHGVKGPINMNNQNELYKTANSFLLSCLQLSH